jgi:hypothetical protein
MVPVPTTKTALSIYQLKITLLEIEPLIWRRIQIPSSIQLCCLHDAFQVVMGWTDSHLHQFEKDGKVWGDPRNDEFGEFNIIDEGRTTLNKALKLEGDSMVYVYDFGDDWRHEVLLEKIVSVESATSRPVCMGGERRCPPEDVVGAYGYSEFLEAIFDPTHEDYDQFVRWAGGHFQAESGQRWVTHAVPFAARLFSADQSRQPGPSQFRSTSRGMDGSSCLLPFGLWS